MTTTPTRAFTEQSGAEAAVVADLATAAAARPIPISEHAGGILAVPDGAGSLKVVDLEKYAEEPDRPRGAATVHDTASFIALLRRYGERGDLPTLVYAERTQNRLTAVLNDYGWGDYRITLNLRTDEEWTAWSGRSGKLSTQADLAEFLEQHGSAITSPPAADIVELTLSFAATRSVEFESGTRTASGETTLVYRETVEAKAGRAGRLTIPDRFSLALPVYDGAVPIAVTALLRYRIDERTLRIGYVLHRLPDIYRAAFAAEVDTLQEALTDAVLIVNGPPPGPVPGR